MGKLLSCYQETFYAAESGCKVWCLEMSSSEEPLTLHGVLCCYGLCLNGSEERPCVAAAAEVELTGSEAFIHGFSLPSNPLKNISKHTYLSKTLFVLLIR